MPNGRLIFARRPAGSLTVDTFRFEESEIPEAGPGQVVCRTVLLSIDPAARAWMQARTYRERLVEGELMPGHGLAEVIASGSNVPAGAIVTGPVGWQEYALLDATAVRTVEVRSVLSHYLGVLGITGITAHIGLLAVGQPRPGETVLISGAAGATGNVAGQLARIHGCRVVGIAGSSAKTTFLVKELGFDAAVDHRSRSFADDLKSACPDGVDVYFDNVGGPILERVLRAMNAHGRIVCCGGVSQYDTQDPAPGPRGVPGLLTTKRLRMEGFIVHDHVDDWPAAHSELESHVAAGRLRVIESVIEGLDRAPQALISQLKGSNLGKCLVRVGKDPEALPRVIRPAE
jgi:NADPH-dependent curcumin reductase CurA